MIQSKCLHSNSTVLLIMKIIINLLPHVGIIFSLACVDGSLRLAKDFFFVSRRPPAMQAIFPWLVLLFML